MGSLRRTVASLIVLCVVLAGCATTHTGESATSSSATARATSMPRDATTSTTAARSTGCQPANGTGYVALVLCYLSRAGIANQTIDGDCGPLLAHDLQDPGHACVNEIESYQVLLSRAQSDLRLQDIASVSAKVRTPARWLSRAVTDDLAAARRATAAIRSHDYLGFLDAWGVHAKAGRDLQAAAATFAAQ